MASADPPRTPGQDHGVYFRYGHSADSSVCILDDGDSMSEREVQSYIISNNSALYERLRGMPFTSADIPLSLDAQRRLKRAHEIEESLAISRHGYESAGGIAEQGKAAERTEVGPVYFPHILEQQFKRYVQTSLLHGHILILKKHPSICTPLTCDSPVCLYGGLVHPDTFYLIMRPSYFRASQKNLVGPLNHTYYTLRCLEHVFHGEPGSEGEFVKQVAETSLDGVSRSLVAASADRFYQIHEDVVAERESEMTSVSSDCEGSDQRQELQSLINKRIEIESALIEIGKFERKRGSSQSNVDAVTPDLHITRPPYMETPRDRYKKQGLGPHDRRLANREEKRHRSLNAGVSPVSDVSDQSADRQCYCREPGEDEEGMVKCANDWCSIGWFHLRCVGPRGLPVAGEKFLCEYCREDYGPFKPLVYARKGARVSDSSSAMTQGSSGIQDSAPSTGDDSWDAHSDWEQHEEEDVAVVIRSSNWGIPINLQSLPEAVSQSSDKQKTGLDSEVLSPENPDHHRQMDGFTAVNSPTAPVSPEQVETPLPRSTSSKANSPLAASSHIVFTDLALFMFADGLSEMETQIFEAWKIHNTSSSTVGFDNSDTPQGSTHHSVSENGEILRGITSQSLSSLLEGVQQKLL